jgi:formylglycine-generating enzyme required for sulfatase activity
MKFSNILKRVKSKYGLVVLGILIFSLFIISFNMVSDYTSTDKYCVSCHIHPVPDQNWRLSEHYNNKSGFVTHCVECHLPPKGHGYLPAKAKHGLKDIYGKLFKDSASIDWEAKKSLENAKGYVYEQSCKKCHQNLFPATLSVNGSNAHLQYVNTSNGQKPNCINCHLNVGHYDKNNLHAHNTNFGVTETVAKEVFTEATKVQKFENFAEKVPGTTLSFDMVAIPEGTFEMGSPDKEELRKPDEGPVRKVHISKFWMGKAEVSWDEYLEFFKATASQGRKEAVVNQPVTDAITGPTPPWGAPDQGWGKGSHPAITMSWKAASTYCLWLSKKTGKKYRLPTEAEWEYACRGGSQTPYFFAGSPKKFTSAGIMNKLFGADTTVINAYVIYKENSQAKTREPESVKANPFGLKNMLGNVAEFCSDFYAPNTYKTATGTTLNNPTGPENGQEHVIRGGSFKSDAKDVRSAARDFTKTKAWLMTDPQMPKSVWWYSDSNDVGFRVVCESDSTIVGQ